MQIASLFSGAGGLDKGFEQAGFKTIWANEYDKTIWDTYRYNFPNTFLDTRSITNVLSSEIPEIDGIIGGPPCQSWSEAGTRKGINDSRGKLFYDYIRILQDKQPKFFLAENVSGMLQGGRKKDFLKIIHELEKCGYDITYSLVNANDFNVPQDRLRVIIVGYNKNLNKSFEFPKKHIYKPILKDAIYDLYQENILLENHEYMEGGFSSIYMSRNRVRSWDEPSFTIQAGGRHAPIHPQAPKMILVEKDKRIFEPSKENLYRRLSIRECARIQTFPDDFIFKYKNISDGYKMVGNAVPVNLAYELAQQIKKDLIENN